MRILLSLFLSFFSLILVAQQDLTPYVIVDEIVIEGNNITKPSIIYREMTFAVGDTISENRFNEEIKISKENLQNTTLFNFVDIETIYDGIEKVTIVVKVTERWYIWPYPYLVYSDRNLNSWYEADDFSRFSYGFDLEYKNFLGLKHSIKLTMIGGYNQNYGFTYDVPYLDKRQSLGLEFGAGYKRDKEVAYATEANKVQYFNVADEFAKQTVYVMLKPYYRFGYRNRLFLAMEYNDTKFSDSLPSLNDDFVNVFGETRFQYISLSLTFKNDFRDEQNYPLNGHYLEMMLHKNGIGVFETAPDDFYGKMTFDWYQPIKGRWYWASNVTAKFSYGSDVAYFLNQGLGYKNDYVRTYDLYVIDAANFALMKNNLKFAILNPTTMYVPFIKNERFGKIHLALYANVFFDCAYSWNMPGNPSSFLDNRFIYGTGVGIDFVTYYDKVIRFEYGINDMGETGLFIHLVAPI